MPSIQEFKNTIWEFYRDQGRVFPWREVISPYRVFISEIMLQQTQTDRVKDKFLAWVALFPDFQTLAAADQRYVLMAWSGLGYNRRALYVHAVAKKVVSEYGGMLPSEPDVLKTFPGIGPNTAGSICAFAFNTPTIFIETNIRAVFIHFFFKDTVTVHDKELMPLIEAALDYDNPRDWYYALMDYGVMLKKTLINPARKSAHHTRQSRFEGSERQIRGMILRALTQYPSLTEQELCGLIPRSPERVIKNLNALCDEGFLCVSEGLFFVGKGLHNSAQR